MNFENQPSIQIDSHQHYWKLSRGDYDWLTRDFEVLYRDYEPDDLKPLLGLTGVSRSIVVQAAPTVSETLYLLEQASRHSSIAGVVGWVNFDDSKQAIEDLERLSENPYFLGVRPMIQDVAGPNWMLGPQFQEVFSALKHLKLTFDALVRPIHLPNLIRLLSLYPEQAVVIDHGAKPNIASDSWEPWAAQMKTIGSDTSAFCKISGLITETGAHQSYDAIWKYCDHLLDCFGAERLLWGSDWPVLNLRGTYEQWHAAFLTWLSNRNPGIQDKLLGENAASFYSVAQSQ